MKKSIFLLSLLMVLSCTTRHNFNQKKEVIIAGKVLNFDLDNPSVHVAVHRPGLKSIQITERLDSLGNFKVSFESYIPSDVWILHRINFIVLTHPGDSIFVEFDGSFTKRPDLLKSIRFAGNAAKQNRDAAKFQFMYFSNLFFSDWQAKQKAIKELDTDDYLHYLDSLKTAANNLYQQYVTEVKPDREIKTWAKIFLDEVYYDALAFYPYDHQRANRLKSSEWSVPASYFEPLKNRLPITESMFIASTSLSQFVNRYHYNYVMPRVSRDFKNMHLKPGAASDERIRGTFDSLYIHGIIKYTPDNLLRQMVLTEIFEQNFEKSEVRIFENFKGVATTYIKEPFLKEPLYEHYRQLKQQLENPKISRQAVLKKITTPSGEGIMDSILQSNRGKVVYLDCWATWCGPCKTEMPNSKNLMLKMQGKDVSFVYVCLDSKEKIWKAALTELQLSGQHYFLNQEQSANFRKVFKINGVPCYFLIDRKGTIIDKGFHLRPNYVKGKIERLLKE